MDKEINAKFKELALIEGYKDVEAQKRRIEFAKIEDVGSEIVRNEMGIPLKVRD